MRRSTSTDINTAFILLYRPIHFSWHARLEIPAQRASMPVSEEPDVRCVGPLMTEGGGSMWINGLSR